MTEQVKGFIGGNIFKADKSVLRLKKTQRERLASPFSIMFYGLDLKNTHKEYPAQLSAKLASDMIQLYSREGERVLDPFCGSGTVPFEAALLGRVGIGIDIEERAVKVSLDNLKQQRFSDLRYEIHLGDARNLPFENNTIDLVVTSPPYGQHYHPDVWYGDHPDNLSNLPDWAAFRKNLKICIGEIYRVLKPGRVAVFVTEDIIKFNYPLLAHLTVDAESFGFRYYTRGVRIYLRAARQLHPYGPPDKRKFIPCHEDVLVMEKPE